MKKLFKNVFFQCFLFLFAVPGLNVLLYHIYTPSSLMEVFWMTIAGCFILVIILFAIVVADVFRK